MVVAADRDPARRQRISELYPMVRVETDASLVFQDPSIDAVVIATPVETHYPLAKQALSLGKHVLVEKPLVTDPDQAEELIYLAETGGRVLMVGHTFEYTAAVNRIREIIASGELGEILYIRSLRVNLGLFQTDINVLWDLAPHDVSILLYVLQMAPTAVMAVGNANINRTIEDVASITIEFDSDVMANIIVSWLDPRKVREMTIVGSKKMLVYDDTSANEKLRIFDKGVDGPKDYESFGEFPYSYRYGDIVTPFLQEHEPLREECAHFLGCIKTGETPRSGGKAGLDVARVLSAAEASLRAGGQRVELAPIPAIPAQLSWPLRGNGQVDTEDAIAILRAAGA
jgi:predicted dehydrogenase